MDFGTAVANFPEGHIKTRPPSVEYTFWHLIEHLRITQLDILEYVTTADYREKAWPADYWPSRDELATKEDWDRSVAAFERDLEQLVAIVADDSTDLTGPVPSTSEHSILREMLIVADHNSYHIGELGILRQIEHAWGPTHKG
jgi:DinB superfamily